MAFGPDRQTAAMMAQNILFSVRKGMLAGLLCLALASLPLHQAGAQATQAEVEEATTNLFIAIDQNNLNAVQASLTAGADLNAVNAWNMTPADYAVEKGHYDIAHFLLSAKQQKLAAEAALQEDNDPAASPSTRRPPPPPSPASQSQGAKKLPPRPSRKAAIESQALDAAPSAQSVSGAPVKPAAPAWPKDKPNPFDPNYVASGSSLKASGPIRGAAELEAEEKARQAEARRLAEQEKAEKLKELEEAERERREEEAKLKARADEEKARRLAEEAEQQKAAEADRIRQEKEAAAKAEAEAKAKAEAEAAKKKDDSATLKQSEEQTAKANVQQALNEEPATLTNDAVVKETAEPGFFDQIGNLFSSEEAPSAAAPNATSGAAPSTPPAPSASRSAPSLSPSPHSTPAPATSTANDLHNIDATRRLEMAKTEEAYRRAAEIEEKRKAALSELKETEQKQQAALREAEQARRQMEEQVKKFEQQQQIQSRQLAEAKAREQAAIEAREQALAARKAEEEKRLAAFKKAEEERKKSERLAYEKSRLEAEARKRAEEEAKRKAEEEARRLAEEAERQRLEELRKQAELEAKRQAEIEAKRRAEAARLEMARRAVEGKPKVDPEQALKLAEEEKKRQALAAAEAAQRQKEKEAELARLAEQKKKEELSLREAQEKAKQELKARLEREAIEEEKRRQALIEEARYAEELQRKLALPETDPAMEKAILPTTETFVAESKAPPPATPRKPEITHEQPGFFDQLADMIGLSEEPDPAQETILHAPPKKAETAPAPKDAIDEEMARITAQMPHKPRAEIRSATYLPNVNFSLGENMPIGKPLPKETKMQGDDKNCVQKKRGSVAFCLEKVHWPSVMKPHVTTSSVLYKGQKAIVRYDGDRATRYHSLFPSESFEAIASYFGQKYGPPTEQWKRTISPLAKPKLPNPTFIWRTIDTTTRLVTTLEVRKYDDTRGGFPDTKRGAILFYNAWSQPIFPELSSLELMALKPAR